MGNNFSSKYELFRNVKADDKKGLNKNYGIFLVLRRKTGSGKAVSGDKGTVGRIKGRMLNSSSRRDWKECMRCCGNNSGCALFMLQ